MLVADWPNNQDRSSRCDSFRIGSVALLFVLACYCFADQHSSPQGPSIPASSPPTKTLYKHSETWYEFLLKQFNPNDLDYGSWVEQRRRVFLEASVRNRYFRYGASVTILLLITILLYGKQWADHRRILWITAEMMTDLYNHDAYSRRIAGDAIRKYNDHIERCNRAIEVAEYGLTLPNHETEADRLRTELQRVTEERDSVRRERDLAKDDLAQKERILADMSLRLDTLAKKSSGHRSANGVVDSKTSDQKLMQHINTLQEQLYSERHENRRLKGA